MSAMIIYVITDIYICFVITGHEYLKSLLQFGRLGGDLKMIVSNRMPHSLLSIFTETENLRATNLKVIIIHAGVNREQLTMDLVSLCNWL